MADNGQTPEYSLIIAKNLLRAIDAAIDSTRFLASRIDKLERRIDSIEERFEPRIESTEKLEEDNYDYAADDLNFDAARERGSR